MAVSYQQVLEALPTLGRKDLNEVRKRCIVLSQGRVEPREVPVEDEDWLLLGVLHELTRRGLDGRVFRLKSTGSYAGFASQSERVREVLMLAAPDLTAVERRALGRVAAKALANYITWTAVTRDSLLTYISRVPVAIDAAYPGYLEHGMLKMVILAHVR